MYKLFAIITLLLALSLSAETLFEVKDAQDSTVFQISNDGMRVFNNGDTLMVISSTEIKAFIDENVKDKALSRSFSVTTSTSAEKLVGTDVFNVGIDATTMREGVDGDQYTDFSPQNIFLGLNSGINNTGKSNVFVGNSAGANHTDGWSNVFIGGGAGFSNNGGDANVFIGLDAGRGNVSAGSNTYVGCSAGYSSTGVMNAFFGYASGYLNTGDYNSFLGQNCGSFNTGSNNVFMGYYAGQNSGSGSGNVFLGYKVGENETGSNKLYIDNSNTNTPLIYGDFTYNRVGINDGVPSANLHIKQYGLGEEGFAIENDGDTDVWSWEIGGNDLNLAFNGIDLGYWEETDGSYILYSDKRLKKDVETINESLLSKVLKLELVRYRFLHAGENTQKTIGFIAQDVQALFPELVKQGESEYLSLNYADFGVVSIKAIQEQQKIIGEQQIRIEKLESRLERIEKLLKN